MKHRPLREKAALWGEFAAIAVVYAFTLWAMLTHHHTATIVGLAVALTVTLGGGIAIALIAARRS